MIANKHDQIFSKLSYKRRYKKYQFDFDIPKTFSKKLISNKLYAIAFGNHSTNWLENLKNLLEIFNMESDLISLTYQADLLLKPIADEILILSSIEFNPVKWALTNSIYSNVPTYRQLNSAAIYIPGNFITQIATWQILFSQNMDTETTFPPVEVVGYSYGEIAAKALEFGEINSAELLALSQIISAAGIRIARDYSIRAAKDRQPMILFENINPEVIYRLIKIFNLNLGSTLSPVISIRNRKNSTIVTGTSEQLLQFEFFFKQITEKENSKIIRKIYDSSIFNPVFGFLNIEIGLHNPYLADAVEIATQWAEIIGINVQLAREISEKILFSPIDWIKQVTNLYKSGVNWIFDLGPGNTSIHLTKSMICGLGVEIILVTADINYTNLFTIDILSKVKQPWFKYAPSLIYLPDKSIKLSNNFTRLTGLSPILLPGMTPTTVDSRIVAAAANSGYWSELAGGGQVTESIFNNRIFELEELLDPGRAIQFNTLFLDPQLWKLHISDKRVVQNSRKYGGPIDGLIISAGIPEIDEVVKLVEELNQIGISYIVFKPGTIDQIYTAINIATNLPSQNIILHIESGHSGGHHSWESLDEMLLATYADIREQSNITICVGGGISTPKKAANYLLGFWSKTYNYTLMPIDGIFIGTVAMTTLEATTSFAVKNLLINTLGSKSWVHSGNSINGVASGYSQFGANIHEVDNTASRCGRFLDRISINPQDAEKPYCKNTIVAMSGTSKQYFGEVIDMTYLQWLYRYIELTVGADNSTADTRYQKSSWLDISWRNRFEKMLKRTEARLNVKNSGLIKTNFDSTSFKGLGLVEKPKDALTTLASIYIESTHTKLHPADVCFFIEICKSLGKPVNFVPILSKSIKEWWSKDSLWQSHDSRYENDQVYVISGPSSVFDITSLNEPISNLLERFERISIESLLIKSIKAKSVFTRFKDYKDYLSIMFNTTSILWAGRILLNPLYKISMSSNWIRYTGLRTFFAEENSTSTRIEIIDSSHIILLIPFIYNWVNIRFTMSYGTQNGSVPVVDILDASTSMYRILAACTDQGSTNYVSKVFNRVSKIISNYNFDQVIDYAYSIANLSFLSAFDLVFLPDALIKYCWPSIFSTIGSIVTEYGFPVVADFMKIMHLDHSIRLLSPTIDKQTVIAATSLVVSDPYDTIYGRIVSVLATINKIDGTKIAELEERLVIKDYTNKIQINNVAPLNSTVLEHYMHTSRDHKYKVKITVPSNMQPFALVSGDYNPIHTSNMATPLASLDYPVTHGMWLSATGQYIVLSVNDKIFNSVGLTGWNVRFMHIIKPGNEIEFNVYRVGFNLGSEIIEVQAYINSEIAMIATAILKPHKTVYAFPGQGIQHKNMGMEVYLKSKAAKNVWRKSDNFTRSYLGFSIISVVKNNPTSLTVCGKNYKHPNGVLSITPFTQVAMATTAAAQVAELRDKCVFDKDSFTCGHSVGEYIALSCILDVINLNDLLEIVFQRGSKMYNLILRNSQGLSNYRLAAIQSSKIDLNENQVKKLIFETIMSSDEFIQIVNFNVYNSQYVVAGTVYGLKVLKNRISTINATSRLNGSYPVIQLNGIDIPFHSKLLQDGVSEFRCELERIIPHNVDYIPLVGRYIPNLIPCKFTLDREFIQSIRNLVLDETLDEILADYDMWREKYPVKLCRKIIITLLSWQFAMPVRWIEVQNLLFLEEDKGGLGIRRFIEVGVKNTPTVANLANSTLKLSKYNQNIIQVINTELDAKVIFNDNYNYKNISGLKKSNSIKKFNKSSSKNISFNSGDALIYVIAINTRLNLDQINYNTPIDSIIGGSSLRRNKLTVDLSLELSIDIIFNFTETNINTLKLQIKNMSCNYKPFGLVLSPLINNQIYKIFGPFGKSPEYITERIKNVWNLGSGWDSHTKADLALAIYNDEIVQKNKLDYSHIDELKNLNELDNMIDLSIKKVGKRHNIDLIFPTKSISNCINKSDSLVLGEFKDRITGLEKLLSSISCMILDYLDLKVPKDTPTASNNSEIIGLLDQELGSNWLHLVTPIFNVKKNILLDDRWASAREDLIKLWLADEKDVSYRLPSICDQFFNAGYIVANQAKWWMNRSIVYGRVLHASLFKAISVNAENSKQGFYEEELILITGASKNSIASSLIKKLLYGGGTVIATTSKLSNKKLKFYRDLYCKNARFSSKLWIVPSNMASYTDIDELVKWISSRRFENQINNSNILKNTQIPTLLFPFATPTVSGELLDIGSQFEVHMKILLWAVYRLISDFSVEYRSNNSNNSQLHIVLPGSPNRGLFGGGGAYGEAKTAFDALINRWHMETSWSSRISFVHALIGWTEGTGLVNRSQNINNLLIGTNAIIYNAIDIATLLLELCTEDAKLAAIKRPISVDLTGGLKDLKNINFHEENSGKNKLVSNTKISPISNSFDNIKIVNTILALPSPPYEDKLPLTLDWNDLTISPSELVVIVGGAELGPYGSSRTRFEMEISNKLSTAGVIELAWTTGLIYWNNESPSGWYDMDSGEFVHESDILKRYNDIVMKRCGIRSLVDDGIINSSHSLPLLVRVFLEKDFSFRVSNKIEALSFMSSDPKYTTVCPISNSTDWQVTRKAGSEIRIPRKAKLACTVGAQIPTGFEPTVWGITQNMLNAIDRIAIWNIITTVDAFLSSGFTPNELMRWIHPSMVASTQGTGMGGMASIQRMYYSNLLGEHRSNNLIQEMLPNIIAAHVMQSYIGGYGSTVHPVGACATGAVSIEEGVDKIRLGKAQFVLTGSFDDLTPEGVVGFSDMSTTTNTEIMRSKGITDKNFSRANDNRRDGFLEAQGGGTVLLTRGDLAADMGLPVMAVIGYAQSFSDGINNSIPKPGFGALSAGCSDIDFNLSDKLSQLGVSVDEISIISKHDTATLINDIHETELHELLAKSMKKSIGAPLFIISQKTLTGHAKGGAAVFQTIGLCQVLQNGIIPPNRSLDCIDNKLSTSNHFVWVRDILDLKEKFTIKAGLITSLGFGHVSGIIALVHPNAFVATLNPVERINYCKRARKRILHGKYRLLKAIYGGHYMYEKPSNRRFSKNIPEIYQEITMLLNPNSRLDENNIYVL